MNLECEHASTLGKKMSWFGRAVIEIFNFFSVSLLMVHPVLTYWETFGKNNGQSVHFMFPMICYLDNRKDFMCSWIHNDINDLFFRHQNKSNMTNRRNKCQFKYYFLINITNIYKYMYIHIKILRDNFKL